MQLVRAHSYNKSVSNGLGSVYSAESSAVLVTMAKMFGWDVQTEAWNCGTIENGTWCA